MFRSFCKQSLDKRSDPLPTDPTSQHWIRCNLDKARFKRRATAVPNSVDQIKFDFSTAVARRLKPSRATAV